MPQLGRQNRLTVCRQSSTGTYLDAGRLGEAFLPPRQTPQDCAPGDELDVFLYLDSDDSLVASLQRPQAMTGELAQLTVSAVNATGAFLSWGLDKELLLPHGEQTGAVNPGDTVLVKVYLDQRGRLVSSMKLDRHLQEQLPDRSALKPGQAVNAMIIRNTELGYKCAINGEYWGVIYKSDFTNTDQVPPRGKPFTAYLRRVRPDARLDISFLPPNSEQATELSSLILQRLEENDGFLALGDKTSPETIKKLFKVSKKVFKKALSQLYKERRIVITDNGISLPDLKKK
jgi:uncharacterized protein